MVYVHKFIGFFHEFIRVTFYSFGKELRRFSLWRIYGFLLRTVLRICKGAEGLFIKGDEELRGSTVLLSIPSVDQGIVDFVDLQRLR